MDYHGREGKVIARKISKFVNGARKEHGCSPLDQHSDLKSIANKYARLLCLGREYGHYVNGTPQERAADFAKVNENLYRTTVYGFAPSQTARAAVDGWLSSDAHRETMLREDANIGGVGVATGGDTVYICHLVAERKRTLPAAVDKVRNAIPL